MKLTFIIGALDAEHYAAQLLKILTKQGHEIEAVVISKVLKNALKKAGIKKIHYVFEHFDKIKIPKNINKELAKFEKKYKINSLNQVYVSDLEQTSISRKKSLQNLYRYFVFFEKFLEKSKPDTVIGGYERFHNQVALSVCKKLKIPFYYTEPTSPFPSRFWISNLSNKLFCELEYAMKRKKSLTKNERKRAAEFVTNELNKKYGHLVIDTTPKISFQKFKYFLKMTYISIFVESKYFLYLSIKRGVKNYILRKIRYFRIKPFYKKPSSKDKIIFFPLHVANDSYLRVGAPHYKDQIFLVNIIADSIPIDSTLYVKEHPGLLGELPTSDLKKIAKLPNVKLIDPRYSSRDLIKKSDRIITIKSKVGWEAITNLKPCLCLAESFYDQYGLCMTERDLYNIPQAIHDLKNFKVDNEKLYKFISSMYDCTIKGDLPILNMYYNNEIDSNKAYDTKNMNMIANGIIDFIKKWNPITQKKL